MKLSGVASLAAIVVCLLGSAAARAEDFNEYVTLTYTQGTSFTMVLKGNVISSINLVAMKTDVTVNPFYWVIVNLHGGVGTSTVTATLNSEGNTVVTFTGTYPVPSGQTNSPGHPPHFGLDPSAANGTGPKISVVSQGWSNGPSKKLTPAVSVSAPTVAANAVGIKYQIFFANVTQGSQTVGEWFEIPYTGASPPTITPTVYTGGNVTLSNAGFQLSNTMIPLDNLNFGDYPPLPGGSGWTATPQIDGPLSSSPSPEPATWALMILGIGAVGGVARARRSARA
jgi:hypothetical protein